MKIFINGDDGHMGGILAGIIAQRDDLQQVTKEENPDVVIDFSHFSMLDDLLDFCTSTKTPVVIATTGYTEEQENQIKEASSQIPVFRSANMSLGVALVKAVAKEIAEKFPGCDVEIIETHHNRKLDAPSGTALMLADAVKEARPESSYRIGRSGHQPREKNEIGIQSIRVGNVVGTHEIIFGTNSQTIKLTHEAHDRALFAEGSIDAAKFLVKQAPGYYNMDDLIRG